MKVYKREVLEKIVPMAKKNRFALDVELLALAEHCVVTTISWNARLNLIIRK